MFNRNTKQKFDYLTSGLPFLQEYSFLSNPKLAITGSALDNTHIFAIIVNVSTCTSQFGN